MTDRPTNRRGTPITRFNPLRDSVPSPVSDEMFDEALGIMEQVEVTPPYDLIKSVQRRIVDLGLQDSPEGAMAVTLAEKAVESSGSAAAACLHELRMIMDAIRAANPAGSVSDPTEDILGRRRRERGA